MGRDSEEETVRPKRSIRFSGSAEGKHTGGNHKEAVAVFSDEVKKLVEATPELKDDLARVVTWRLFDTKSNQADGEDPVELIEEFEIHGLVPTRLFRHQMSRVENEIGVYYELFCWYWMDGRVSLEVTGPNRVVIDGLKAWSERIVERVVEASSRRQSETTANVQAPILTEATANPTRAEEDSQNWWKRTWRDHTMAAALTVGSTVAGGGILAYLKWN